MYSSGFGQKEHVVYEGVAHDGLKHIIQHKVGSRSLVNQQEQAQRLAYPRSLTPEQQELMSWHHRLYHLPFHKMLTLAKFGMLPK